MPVAIPTWRKVLLMPEAMPLREWCTTPMAVEASGGLIIPMPAPASTKPGIRVVQPEVGVDGGHRQQPGATSSRPRPEQQPDRHAHAQPPGDRRDDERQQRHRQEAQAGLQRAVAEHVLDVERQVQEHREHRRRDRERDDARAGERRPAEQREVEHRPLLARARRRRTARAAPRRRSGRRRSRVEPQPFSLPWTSANTSRNSEPENVTRPAQSTPARVRVARLGDLRERQEHGRRSPIGTLTKKIHSQPIARGDQRRRRPGRPRPPRRSRPPNTPKATPRSLPWKAVGDQRQRGGEHHRPARALHGAREVQHERACPTARRRPRRP